MPETENNSTNGESPKLSVGYYLTNESTWGSDITGNQPIVNIFEYPISVDYLYED